MSRPDAGVVDAVHAAVLERGARQLRNDEWRFPCPESTRHRNGDAHASCRWNREKATYHCDVCGAGGGAVDLARRLGVQLPPRNGKPPPGETVWTIKDASGAGVAEHVRRDSENGSKRFIWRRNGKLGLGGLRVEEIPLYGAHELAAMPADAPVVVVEGEKARDALVARGISALGTVTGASGTPADASLRVLVGRNVVLWPDNDAPGNGHMQRIAARLLDLGGRPRWFAWAEAPEAGDAADCPDQTETLRAQLATAPPWAPSSTEDAEQKANPDATPREQPNEGGRPLFVRAANLSAPPVTYRVDSLLADGMLHILAGRDKRGKTLLAEEIGRCVLRGVRLFGQFDTRPGLVMAALLDDPLPVTLDRLDTLDVRNPGDDFWIVDPTAFEDPTAFLDALEAEAMEAKPALIILDALYLFLPASRDAGNDAARMAPVMRKLDRLATRTGAAVLVIAHDNKGGSDVAGSYVVRAVAKVVMRIAVPKGEGEDEEGPTTSRRALTVESKLGASTSFLLDLQGVGNWRYLGEPRTVRAGDVKDAVRIYILSGGSGTAEEIADAVHRRRADVDAALAALVLNGEIASGTWSTGKRGRPGTVYSRPAGSGGDRGPDENSAAREPENPSDSLLGDFPSRFGAPRENGERDENSAPCRTCGEAAWWTQPGGARVCGVCHPDPRRPEAR